MLTIDDAVLRDAQTLWDSHNLDLGLRDVDFVLAMGCHDERVAVRAAELVLTGRAPLLVTSGGLGKVTGKSWQETEGDRFAEIAKHLGVPSRKIIVERRATNTGENIQNTQELLMCTGVRVASGILVTKPYMRRRAYATAAQQWNTVEWLVASPELSFADYPDATVSQEQAIQLMVGDLQRIKVYAETGFQIAQEIPSSVWEAYRNLVRRGFDKYVIPGHQD